MPKPQRTPGAIAIERLAKMTAAGAPPSRMISAVDDILIGWGGEGLDASDLRERVEQLQDQIDGGIQAAEDYVGEAETEKGRAAARGQLVALTAARERLAAAVEGRPTARAA